MKINPPRDYRDRILRAYRKKRNRKRKICYRHKLYNIKHGKIGGRQ